MFLFFKISSLLRGPFTDSQFSGTSSWSLYTLKRLLFLESSVQNVLISTLNLLIIPGPLFCLVYLSPMMISIISSWSWRFPSSESSSTVALFWPLCDRRSSLINDLFLLWFDDDTRLWSLSPLNTVTTSQDAGSKFSGLSKSPACSGSNSRACREMVSAAEGIAWFEEILGSWNYCNLGKFACIWSMVFSICVTLDIILSRVSCSVGVADEGSGAICVISVCCWSTVILGTGSVYKMGTAVFWTSACSVIAVKEVSIRPLLSILGSNVIPENFKLIPF